MPIHMIEKTIIDLKAIIAGLASYKTVVDDTKALANAICAALQGNFVESLPALAIGSTKTNVANGAFDYLLGGKRYSKAANPVGTAGNADVIPQNKYGAMAFDIDNTGTITAISAVANAAGYASAALAVAGLPASAAGRARMGYVTVVKTAAAFTFGTDNLDVATSTVVYVDGTTAFNAIGAAVTSVTPTTPTQVSGYR